MKSLHASFAIAVAVVAATSSLRAQSPVPDPDSTPVPASPVQSGVTPVTKGASQAAKKEPSVRKAVLEKYDKNKNGILDPEERAEFERDAPARKAERLKKYDKNGDGKLDGQEDAVRIADQARERASQKPSAARSALDKPILDQ